MLAEFIKNATRHLHDKAEEKFQSKKIFEKDYSLEDYKNFLGANYRLIAATEPEIEAVLPSEFSEKINYPERGKLPHIAADAADLGLQNPANNLEEKPENIYEALGMLYVLEGASLGGNVIRKKLAATPGFEEVKFRYLGMYGEEISQKWKTFLQALEAFVPEEKYPEILAGAEKTYRFIIND